MNYNHFHAICGHQFDKYAKETAKKLGINLTGSPEDCIHCARGKIKKTKISKEVTNNEKLPGERIVMDIMGCKKASKGGNKYVHVKIDYGTKMIFTTFMKKKSEAIEDGINFVKMQIKMNKMPK